MQPGRTTSNGGRNMEVKTTAPHCQLLLIVLMAAMLLSGMKVSPLLVQKTVTRTIELQENIGRDQFGEVWNAIGVFSPKSDAVAFSSTMKWFGYYVGFYHLLKSFLVMNSASSELLKTYSVDEKE
ncbi:hypothetical protein STEG23_033781 [Scotinomys teguina]